MISEKPKRPRQLKAIAYWPVFEAAQPTKQEARAFKAMRDGVASDVQQKLVLEFIVNKICRYDDMEFRHESEGGYAATGVAAGKRFVGQQIRALLSASGQFIERLPD